MPNELTRAGSTMSDLKTERSFCANDNDSTLSKEVSNCEFRVRAAILNRLLITLRISFSTWAVPLWSNATNKKY